MTYSLRSYQQNTLDAVYRDLVAGLRRLLVRSATGTGKTVTFAHILRHDGIKSWLADFPDQRMLVIAHREELLDQAAAKIRDINPKLMVSVEQGDRAANRYSDVVVASIQTLAARDFRRLRSLIAHTTFRVVVVDECHHAAARSYREALSLLGFLPSTAADVGDADLADDAKVAALEQRLSQWDAVAPKDRMLLGVTATPNRSDAIGLSCVFQTISFSYGMKDAVADGNLAPPRAFAVATDTSLDAVKTVAGEFNQRELADAVNTPARNVAAYAAWRDHAQGRPTLSFTVDVDHAHDAAAVFQKAGVRAEPISGKTPTDQRRALLSDYTAGRVDALFNAMLLTEGTDLPRTSCILNLKPTKSATLYEQMVGRGLRLFQGKEDCIIIDMVDVARRHSLMAAPMLYGLPPLLAAQGKDLRDVEREVLEMREQYPNADIAELLSGLTTIDGLRKRLSALNIWDVQPLPEGLVSATSLDWLRVGEELRLSYPWLEGNETLSVTRDVLGHWDVVTTFRPRESKEVRQRTIITGLHELAEAAVRAEQYVTEKRHSVTRLASRSAGWKGNKATDKQLAYLRRLKVPFRAGISAGEASRLIDVARARR